VVPAAAQKHALQPALVLGHVCSSSDDQDNTELEGEFMTVSIDIRLLSLYNDL
jgi:hypothetical protein